MQFFGYHGVFPEENKLGQRFYVQVELGLDLKLACQHDKLKYTVNYGEAYEIIEHIMTKKTFNLLEALAQHICEELFTTYEQLKEIKIEITKPDPPFAASFEGVSVEICRKRVEN